MGPRTEKSCCVFGLLNEVKMKHFLLNGLNSLE